MTPNALSAIRNLVHLARGTWLSEQMKDDEAQRVYTDVLREGIALIEAARAADETAHPDNVAHINRRVGMREAMAVLRRTYEPVPEPSRRPRVQRPAAAGKDTRDGTQPPAGKSTQPEPTVEPATVEFSDGTVTLTRWHLTELAPDYYGISHMQIGGWLPEGWKSGSISLGTNCMVRADLPGTSAPAHNVNVQIDVKGYGGPQRFMKIQWRHGYDPTRDHRRTGGDAG